TPALAARGGFLAWNEPHRRGLRRNAAPVRNSHYSRSLAGVVHPDLARHESEHRALIAHASNLVNALDPARPARTALAFAYLVDWAETHILQADKAVGEFLAARTGGRLEPALAEAASDPPEPPR
ncbi:MAG: hypothetical protein M0T84_17985, partial [Betaproteobacteria bacterium]|nr:hypothetical protein [Betaproteobacteria bacterium]